MPGHVSARGAASHLESVSSQADAPARGEPFASAKSVPSAHSRAHPDGRRVRRRAQAGAPTSRGKLGVLAGNARAGQGDVSGSAHSARRENEADVGSVDARQVQVGAQGCACQAFAVAHTSTIPPRPRTFKRRREPCG